MKGNFRGGYNLRRGICARGIFGGEFSEGNLRGEEEFSEGNFQRGMFGGESLLRSIFVERHILLNSE